MVAYKNWPRTLLAAMPMSSNDDSLLSPLPRVRSSTPHVLLLLSRYSHFCFCYSWVCGAAPSSSASTFCILWLKPSLRRFLHLLLQKSTYLFLIKRRLIISVMCFCFALNMPRVSFSPGIVDRYEVCYQISRFRKLLRAYTYCAGSLLTLLPVG